MRFHSLRNIIRIVYDNLKIVMLESVSFAHMLALKFHTQDVWLSLHQNSVLSTKMYHH